MWGHGTLLKTRGIRGSLINKLRLLVVIVMKFMMKLIFVMRDFQKGLTFPIKVIIILVYFSCNKLTTWGFMEKNNNNHFGSSLNVRMQSNTYIYI